MSLEDEPAETRIFRLKEASRGLIQFLGETQVGFARNDAYIQADKERRDDAMGVTRAGSE